MKCVILGNGISLRNAPFEKLARVDTFAVNRIHLIYGFTSWRPTFYVRTEPPGGGNPAEFFRECQYHIDSGENCIFPRDWRYILGEATNIEYIPVCRHFKYPPPHKKAHWSWHLPTICDTSVITAAIQVAVLKGYSEIYLLGCDLIGSHFSEDDHGLIQSEQWATQHEIAARCSPIPIYNATMGGALESYPRVDLESVL